MLHPDKANGQQAHDRTRAPVILRALLLGLFLGVAGLPDPAAAETTVLREVRMGDHGKYTRVVFEFSAPVQYQLSENAAAGSVSLRFLETTSKLPGTPVSDVSDCIDNVSTLQDGSHTIANIFFDPKGIKLNPFTIQDPDRVVLDVFCEDEPVLTAAPAEPRNISPEPIKLPEPSPEKVEATRPSVVEQAQIPKKAESAQKRDNSQKFLLLLLAAITGIIVLLIALILFQKRSLSDSHVAGNLDATRDTDDMVRAIDMKIKNKLMTYDE